MDTKLIEQITEMLDKLPNSICSLNTSIDESWIEAGESEFNLKLPEYYRWFIKNYDSIILWGELIKTVFPPEYRDEADQDIFYTYNWNINYDKNNHDKLFFLEANDIGFFYFKIIGNRVSEEVYCFDLSTGEHDLYAENFLDFLKIEIPKNYSNYL